jgi:hypothetical protein
MLSVSAYVYGVVYEREEVTKRRESERVLRAAWVSRYPGSGKPRVNEG